MKDFSFHDNPNFATGRSFRVYGSSESLITEPAKLILVAGIAALAVVNVHVLYTGTATSYVSSATQNYVVLGDATNSSVESGVDPVLYQLHVKTIVRGYLEQRALLETRSNSDTWLELIEITQQSVLDMRVPVQYKDVHFNVVMALLADKQYIETGSEEHAQQTWNALLSEYPWLNSEE